MQNIQIWEEKGSVLLLLRKQVLTTPGLDIWAPQTATISVMDNNSTTQEPTSHPGRHLAPLAWCLLRPINTDNLSLRSAIYAYLDWLLQVLCSVLICSLVLSVICNDRVIFCNNIIFLFCCFDVLIGFSRIDLFRTSLYFLVPDIVTNGYTNAFVILHHGKIYTFAIGGK